MCCELVYLIVDNKFWWKVLHEIPIFHRDIKLANLIRSAADPHKWMLIDWEDASRVPTKRQPHSNSSNHSPRILEDNHGAEVDFWVLVT
jgi:serine/threonine protein kinase